MNITLTGPAEEIIQLLVSKGSYRDANEAINAACLRLLEEDEDLPELPPEYFRAKIQEAADGPFHSDWDAMLGRVRKTAGVDRCVE